MRVLCDSWLCSSQNLTVEHMDHQPEWVLQSEEAVSSNQVQREREEED
jgi:hypothetical protein